MKNVLTGILFLMPEQQTIYMELKITKNNTDIKVMFVLSTIPHDSPDTTAHRQ